MKDTKDTITVFVAVDHNYSTTIMVNKIVQLTTNGEEWTTISLLDGTKQIVHHTVEELTAMMGAKS